MNKKIKLSFDDAEEDPSSSFNSSYCLLSNNDLHFLPYSLDEHKHSSTDDNYNLYSNFLNNKTMSSFDLKNGFNSSSRLCSPSESVNEIDNKIDANLDSKLDKTYRVCQILKNYNSHAIYLPETVIPLENFKDKDENLKVKTLLLKIFSHWNQKENILVRKLTGGITNILLECCYSNPVTAEVEKVLVRAYGNNTDLIIDRDREFVSHLFLNSLNLAPPIHARFGNGLVYGFIEGKSLHYNQLSNNNLYPLIASKLACLHRSADIATIDSSLDKVKQRFHSHSSEFQHNIWSILFDWVEKLPNISSILKLCHDNHDIIANPHEDPKDARKILQNEIAWLKQELSSASLLVTCHNDLLSGNIIVPQNLVACCENKAEFEKALSSFDSNPLNFIDYEYMMPAPRAFDIANHFMEWQGFDCDKSRIPKFTYNAATRNYENETVFQWCKHYLESFNSYDDPTASLDNLHPDSSSSVQKLVNEVASHYGMPGLYWGIWACIQSEISLIDFDYYSYSVERLIEYWNWKREYLVNRT